MSDYRRNPYGDYEGYGDRSRRHDGADDRRSHAERSYAADGDDHGAYSSRYESRHSSYTPSRSSASTSTQRERISRDNPYSRDRYTQSGRSASSSYDRRSSGYSSDRSSGRASSRTSGRTSERVVIDERRNRGGRYGTAQDDRASYQPEEHNARSSRYGVGAGAGRATSAGEADRPSARDRVRARTQQGGRSDIDQVVTDNGRQAGRGAARGNIRGGSRGNGGGIGAGGIGTSGFGDFSRYLNHGPKRLNPLIIVAPVIAVILIAFGIFQIVNPKTYDIVVNGATHTVERGTTINTVLEAGYATPTPGNLLAVDGAVLEQGGGDKFSAVVNGGEPTNDGTTPLKKKTVVEITDGADVMEPYQETTEVIPFQQVEDENYWNGSLHVYIPGSDGVRATRTGEYSGITITEDTTPVVHNQWKIYDANTGGDKVIALTFDDGPWAGTTEDILDVLKQYNAKATFFTVGERISSYPELVKRMAAEGHQVCTHSWDHAEGSGEGVNLTFMSSEEQIQEIEKGIAAIEDVLGEGASRVIRAPGGNFHGDIVWTLQDYITAEIGWDVDTQDWRRPGASAIADSILSAKAGNVILMHDGGGDRTQTVEALKIALPKLVEQGYTFVTVDELLAYGIPENA